MRISRTLGVSDAFKAFKTESSKWIQSDAACPGVAWQAGYGVFSVSASHVEAITEYIRKQPEHHRRRDFKEEVRELLERYKVSYG